MKIFRKIASWLDAIPYCLIALFLRLVAAHPFLFPARRRSRGRQSGARFWGSI